MRSVVVRVSPLPGWIDRSRLLGGDGWTWDPATGTATATRTPEDAADLAARLRGLGLDGHPIEVVADPPLPRTRVRDARTDDARRRRETTPGFTRKGVQLDDEGRWSLTPEVLALALGQQVARVLGKDACVLDAGCGAGGNAIGFARAGLDVIAVERDPARAAMAAHNARVYGVGDRVDVRVGDAITALQRVTADALFLDPPWGTTWSRTRTTADDLPGLTEALTHAVRFPHVWIKVPSSFDTTTLPDHAPTAVFGEAAGDRQRVKYLILHRG